MSVGTVAVAPATRPWRQAALWLATLATFFYVSYGFANFLADQRTDVPMLVFEWERYIPFLAWTIVPYWSINLFYGASFFVCRDHAELLTHVRRLLSCQIGAVICFILFPLQLAVDRPETVGIAGFLFEALTSFDRPYNLAPSLHVALLVVLWDLYARHAPRILRIPLHLWFALIGVSVLTTYQHHFFDLPTGLLLGFFALWLWPEGRRSPLAFFVPAADRRRWTISTLYGLGAIACLTLAIAIGGVALWMIWPAVSLLLVAGCYAGIGAEGFQKSTRGQRSFAARILFAPYLAGARLNAWLWTRKDRGPAEIADGVFIGPLPLGKSARAFRTIIDLTAEMQSPRATAQLVSLPCLDLLPPSDDELKAAIDAIEAARVKGPVLVACALGYGRSAATVAAWLVATGRAKDSAAAIAMIRDVRPRIVAREARAQFNCTNTARRFCAQAVSSLPTIAGRSLP